MLKTLLDRAMENGGVAITSGAVMAWKVDKEGEAWTGPLWVHPDCRRQGIGTALVKEVARQAQGRGCRFLNSKTMAANPATEMYRKMGRTAVKEDGQHVWWRDSIDRIIG
jgi:GNAT superfamily N-acetyltransferase